jgi:hypothetical protein
VKPRGSKDRELSNLVGDWRKNRPDLSWKPNLGNKLQAGPKILAWITTLLFLAGAIVVVLLLIVMSAPRTTREVTGAVMTARKPSSEEYIYALVALPEEKRLLEMRYRGKATLREGQRVTLEEVTMPVIPWKTYSFKDPPPGDEEGGWLSW